MKIFVLLSRIPYPLEKGDKLRAYNQIKELSRNHEIVLCCLNEDKVHPQAVEKLKEFCDHLEIIQLSKPLIYINLLLKFIFTRSSLQVAYFYNKKAAGRIEKLISLHKPDHIYCQLIRVTEYVKNIPIPKTLDYMDALARGMERRIELSPFYFKPFFRIESLRLKRYEHYIFDHFDNKTIISDQDRKLIVNAYNDDIKVIPNGVDFSKFKIKKEEKKFDLLFSGNMSYAPNVNGVEFLINEIMPYVWEQNPDVNVVIAGATPSRKVRQLASEKVTVTGWVKDITEYYNKSRIFIAPMQIGTGLQNKLLEAMALQLPCITSQLANNALGAQNEKEVLIGKEPVDYARHILTLLGNKEKANMLATEGHRFVHQNFNWERCTEKLNRLIAETA